jgi:polyprenyl synthetase
MYMSDLIDARVADSIAFLRDHLSSLRGSAPSPSAFLEHAYCRLSASALGEAPEGSACPHQCWQCELGKLHAAVVFGACVDLIHGAFLIHDDIIDRENIRRSMPTAHAAVRIATTTIADFLDFDGRMQPALIPQRSGSILS